MKIHKYFKSITLFSLFLIFTFNLPTYASWLKTAGGIGTDTGLSVAIDSTGNVILGGYFTGIANFGGGNVASVGAQDIVLAKYSNSGIYSWAKTFGSTNDDRINSIGIDNFGNIIIAGYFNGTINLGGTNLVSAGGRDLFLAKFNSAGIHQWSKSIGSAGDEIAYRIALDSAGNIFVTGLFKGTTDFGGGPIASTYGGIDSFVAKYSNNGNFIWAKNFRTNSDDIGYGIATDNYGDVIVCGVFMAKIDLGGGVLTSAGAYDIYIVKLSGTTGAYQWGQRYGSTIDDFGYNVAVDKSNNVILAGFFNSSISFGGPILTNRGGAEGFVAKYSNTGTYLWAQSFGGIASDTVLGIACDELNNIYATGSFMNTIYIGSTNLTSAGALDIFLIKYDGNGVCQWAERYGGTSNDVGNGVAVSSTATSFITGYFQGTANFNGLIATSPATYDSDLFLFQRGPTSITPPKLTIYSPTNNQIITTEIFNGLATANDAKDGDISNKIYWYQYEAWRTNPWLLRWSGSSNATLAVDGATGPNVPYSFYLFVTNSANLTATGRVDFIMNVPPTTNIINTNIVVNIAQPLANQQFIQGYPVVFWAHADSVPFGDLQNNVVWSSSINGIFYPGPNPNYPAYVTNSSLSVGTHKITAYCKDLSIPPLAASNSIYISIIATNITTLPTLNMTVSTDSSSYPRKARAIITAVAKNSKTGMVVSGAQFQFQITQPSTSSFYYYTGTSDINGKVSFTYKTFYVGNHIVRVNANKSGYNPGMASTTFNVYK